MMLIKQMLVVLAVVAVTGCSGSEDPPDFGEGGCQDGDSQSCECTDGSAGTQDCGADGAWGDCDCVGENTDPVGDGILLLVDRSGSMADDGKWAEMTGAIETVVTTYSEAKIGLVVFPDDTCEGSYDGVEVEKLCRAPDNIEVDVAAGTSGSIIDTLSGVGTCGGTPIGAALRKSISAVDAHGGDVQVVLITDGLPVCNLDILYDDCNCTFDLPEQCIDHSEACLDDAESIAAAQELKGAGANLHVIAYAVPTEWLPIFDSIAVAGNVDEDNSTYCTDATSITVELTRIFKDVLGL